MHIDGESLKKMPPDESGGTFSFPGEISEKVGITDYSAVRPERSIPWTRKFWPKQ